MPDLYHYTTIAGLKGILDRERLWATHVSYLNDTRELEHGIDEVCAMMAESSDRIRSLTPPEGSKLDDHALNSYADLVGLARTIIANHRSLYAPDNGPFVACLSRSRDQLSQWRGYGPAGGYAIRFDHDELASSVKIDRDDGWDMDYPEPSLVQVRYDARFFHAEVTQLVQEFLFDAIDSKQPENAQSRIDMQKQLPYSVTAKVLDIAPQIKHHSFSEEQEYRLIARGFDDFYSEGKLGLIPRMNIGFSTFAVREILVGPGDFAEQRQASLRRYLEKNVHRYPGVEVERSLVPYREL